MSLAPARGRLREGTSGVDRSQAASFVGAFGRRKGDWSDLWLDAVRAVNRHGRRSIRQGCDTLTCPCEPGLPALPVLQVAAVAEEGCQGSPLPLCDPARNQLVIARIVEQQSADLHLASIANRRQLPKLRSVLLVHRYCCAAGKSSEGRIGSEIEGEASL